MSDEPKPTCGKIGCDTPVSSWGMWCDECHKESIITPPPSRRRPIQRLPAPPIPPVLTGKMTNAELAEAIEYARTTIEKVKDPGLQKRLVQQVEKLLDVQLARASAVAIDTQAKTVP